MSCFIPCRDAGNDPGCHCYPVEPPEPTLEERVAVLEDRIETLWNQFMEGLT